MQQIEPSTYVLGDGKREIRRLMLQGQLHRPATREFFEAAGIGAGMSVLDLGSGAGCVSLLLSDLVGSTGRVLGVDMSAAMVKTARARIAALGCRNVEFAISRLEEFETDRRFDAVAGRWIFQTVREPARLVQRFLHFLRPGGIVAISDHDMSIPPWAFPEIPPSMKPLVPLLIALEGEPTQRGAWLSQIFVKGGLPRPELRLDVPTGSGPDWPGYEYLVETLRSLLPTFAEREWDVGAIDLDTLAERLRDEIVAANGVLRLGAMLSAWSRKP